MWHQIYPNERLFFRGDNYKLLKSESFKRVFKGDLGGYVEKVENLIDDAWVSGDARVSEDIVLVSGTTSCDVTLNRNPLVLLRNSLNIIPVDNKIVYRIGKIARAKNYEKSTQSCARGLHASLPNYWTEGDSLIAVEIDIKDIITIQEGKVRVRKLKVIENSRRKNMRHIEQLLNANLFEEALKATEKEIYKAAYTHTGGNQSAAAKLLGVSRSTFIRHMKAWRN